MFKLFTRKFNKAVISMEWGSSEDRVLISPPFLGVVVPPEEKVLFHYGNRKDFLWRFTEKAYSLRLIKNKEPYHVNYWYDGPCGNVGVFLWEKGAYHQIKNSVIGISRLNYSLSDKNTIDIAKKAIEILIENNNIVLFLPMNGEEIEFYENFFPNVMKLNYSAL